MIRRMILGVTFVLFAAGFVVAQPGDEKAPIGTWTRAVGENKLQFKFEARSLVFSLDAGDKKIKVEADYAVARDGSIFGRVAKASDAGDAPQPGMLFSFKIKRMNGTLTISDLQGTDSAEVRNLVEGEYTLKIKKEKE